MTSPNGAKALQVIDSPSAWLRLGVAVVISTIGGVGMWSYMVALPAIQTDFGVSRADASLPFTMVMLGFAGGGVLMGRLADRFGIAVPLGIGTLTLTAGYLAVAMVAEPVAGRTRPRTDRNWLLGQFRAADDGHFTLVRAPARHCRGACGRRQLHRGHHLAAGGAAFYFHFRLARDAYRHRAVLPRHHNAAGVRDACADRRPAC